MNLLLSFVYRVVRTVRSACIMCVDYGRVLGANISRVRVALNSGSMCLGYGVVSLLEDLVYNCSLAALLQFLS